MSVVVAVTQTGPMVTVQDAGRSGWLRYGIPASGPVDRLGFAAANVACGNPPDAAALEVSAGGITIVPERAITLAALGGSVLVDGRATLGSSGSSQVRTVAGGASVHVAPSPQHRWAYLAFAGELAAEPWVGSVATHAASGLGGGVVRPGTELVIRAAAMRSDLDGAFEPPVHTRRFRAVADPQQDAFTAEAVASFTGEPFVVTEQGDRMGVRLDGPRLKLRDGLSLPSEPIVRGAVQVAGDGVATVLLADHQTTGGYPKIATLVSVDVDALAMLPAGTRLKFGPVSPAEAVAITRAELARRDRYLRALGDPSRTLAGRLATNNLDPGATEPNLGE